MGRQIYRGAPLVVFLCGIVLGRNAPASDVSFFIGTTQFWTALIVGAFALALCNGAVKSYTDDA